MTDDEFWKTARDEIMAGEEVTIAKGGRVITCNTLKELWQARAELEGETEHGRYGLPDTE